MHAIRGRLSQRWRSPLGRVAGSGLAGAAIGAAVAGIWNAGWTSNLGCPAPVRGSVDSNICFPADLWLLTITVNCAVIMVGIVVTFTLLRVGPRRATVPGGCVVIVIMIFLATGGFSLRLVKSPPAPWLTAIEAGAGLAAFALIAGGRRIWPAGVLALAVTVAAAVLMPPLVRQQQLTDARLRDLTALGFPLAVPDVPGYHVTAANISEGVLLVVIDQSIPHPGTSEIFFDIGRAGSTWAAPQLAMCASPGRSNLLYSSCTARGPHRWLLTSTDSLSGHTAMAEKAGLVMESSPNGGTVSDSTLIAAVTSLRPASAASLAGLPE